MATQSGSIRRGLPRVPGGEPWPPAGEAPARLLSAAATAAPALQPSAETAPETAQGTTPAPAAVPAVDAAAAQVAEPRVDVPSRSTAVRPIRRGLPRVPGGEPWPPAGEVSVSVRASLPAPATAPTTTAAPAAAAEPASVAGPVPAAAAAVTEPPAPSPAVASLTASALPTPGGVQLRRGLPRVPGGEPWPPAGLAPARAVTTTVVQAPATAAAQTAPDLTPALPAPATVAERPATPEPQGTASAPAEPAAPAVPASASAASAAVQKPSAAKPAAAKPEKPVAPKPEPKLYGSRTLAQWIKRVVLLAVGAIVAAGILVLAARGVTTLPGVPEFLRRYPGEYALPQGAEPGFPWWAQWTHFLNIFLMVLIIRSGYQVRTQQKPPAFWTPKRGGKKISINLWLHQSLDILWLANGLIFVVLLFASGRWVRIVPSSWEVFPNAASALLQYMTLDWPVETGWVNYNSLQQLMYFLVVFAAAPLAAITGVRMSEFWPKNAKALNKAYPVEVARALHFPTMLFFVLFILVHVFLVFATGALRNLNHMFGGTDEVNWAGFWLFAAAIALTTAGWYAARPLVLAPIAKAFGQVSSR